MTLCRILLRRNHGCRTDKTAAGSHLAAYPNLRYGVVILNWITVCILRLNLYVHDFCDIFSLFFFDIGGYRAEDIQALLNCAVALIANLQQIYALHGLKLFLLKVVVDIHDKNSVIERVSKSVHMLLPVKINTWK
jgi:hypothetical protein